MITLQAGDASAAIEPGLGGRLASLRVRGRELLVGPATAGDRSITWGCFLMAPWPGRLAGGRFEWLGRTIQLPLTHGRNSIHGLVWDRPWAVDAATPTEAAIACELPRSEWPMGGIVRQSFALRPGGLAIGASIEAGDAMPAALGWHPWFARGAGSVRLQVDADAVEETRRMLPTGRRRPVAGVLDLRGAPVLGRRRLDHAYADARSPAILAWPDVRLEIAFAPSPASVTVYTPGHAVCVEPQTATPNALALPRSAAEAAGVRFLEPGATLTARLDLTWG